MKPNADQSKAPETKPGASAESKTKTPESKPGSKPNVKPDPKDDLKTLPLAEVEKKLESSPDGLTQAEAQKRLTQYGPNELAEKKTNLFLKFLSYFWGPIPWMIEVAVILSGVVRHWPDFGIILLLLVANAVVGFWEERQAGNAIDALKAKLAIKARVKRDGKWINPPARELVPGDVIRLRLGDIVPADARLLDGDPVEVDQSALTGESLPATRQPGEAVFSGSIIRRGEIGALVYATGEKTYFGKTAQLVQEAHTVSHFQKAVLKIGNYLIILAVALVAVIIAVAIFRGDPILTTLQFALVLTVAAIPVAMPTVLSVTMAVGARLLAKKQAIVSKLVAIEELAGVDMLCADKTGTLTQNKLTLGDPFSVNQVPAEQVILSGALASRADNNDTIDLAVLGGLKAKDSLKAYEVVHFQPFDPVHKRTEATVKGKDGKTFKVTKGAPQVIMKLSANAGQVKSAVEKAVNEFAVRGFRSLGVARAEGDGPWQFLGVLPLFDPPREDAKTTIATARQMGVKVKMVTGDALAIAKETAKKLDMGTNILDAGGLGDSKKEETTAVAESIEQADGFAQVFPEHKFHIVDVLQKLGHIVGMTGDGVNDAPALKKADCGIAVSGATDAARAAAAIVLLMPGLSVIIDAIKESRRIFQRMNSYAIYRIAETLRVLFFMTLAILIFNFYPLTAVMIVMLALLNDGAILSIAYDNVHYKDQPEAWNMRVVLGIATVLGVIGVVAAFGLFYLGERVFHLDRAHIQTLMYLKLSVAGHLTIFLTRTRGPFWSIRPARVLWVAVLGTQIVATLIAVYGLLMTPLGWGWAGFVWGYALLWFLLNDRVKLLAYRILDRGKGKAKPEAQSAPEPGAKAAARPGDKTEAKPEAPTEPKPEANGKPDAKVEPKPEAKAAAGPGDKTEAKPGTPAEPKPEAGAKPDANAAPKPEAKDGAKPGDKTEAKPGTPAEPKPEAGAKPDAKAEPKPETTGDAKPGAKAKTPSDLTPQIAKRAYELYEQRTHQGDLAAQDWEQAKRDIGKNETKAEPKPEAKAEPKPEASAEPKPEDKAEAKPGADAKPPAEAGSKPEAPVEPKPEANAEPKPGAKAAPKPAVKAEAKPEAPAEPKPETNGKPDAKVEPKPEAKGVPNSEAKAEPKPEANAEPKPEDKAEAKPGADAKPPAKAGSKPEAPVEPKPESNAEPKPEAKAKPDSNAEHKAETKGKTASDLTAQLVKRVHKLYEDLGREEVRAVEDLEKTERETPKEEPHQ
jgi:H+-transporting ATPase